MEYEEQARQQQSARNEEIESILDNSLFWHWPGIPYGPFIPGRGYLQDFIKQVRVELSLTIESFKVSYANRFLHEGELPTDILGRSLNTQHRGHEKQVLLLLDPFPGGNWSHPCLIGIWEPPKEIELVPSDFPPSQRDFELVFYNYLYVEQLSVQAL